MLIQTDLLVVRKAKRQDALLFFCIYIFLLEGNVEFLSLLGSLGCDLVASVYYSGVGLE